MDVTQVCKSVVSKFNAVKTRVMVASVVGLSAVLSCSSAFAQTGEDVTVSVPDINYAGVATSVMTALTPAIVAAIGLGLSIWAISFIYRKFKAMGR